ncbi:Rieske (2Fe-2S) protein [Streptomyces sp. AC563]|uniref:Rieske 2Fe-2S domain-containing protein n=1 Tax=Streptomyces buecherae TaxID=2763006 RepID=UPI00164EC067|nr:Rieske 2Fe-2S domain-containing protein [Streptomyces buecherae]MBC3988432.1 Rieske (2Fe-2S) protein [Streptomyces buecherae]
MSLSKPDRTRPPSPVVPPSPAVPRPAAPPPYPDGWFAVASSAELRPGRVLTRRLMGEDVVVYRTRSGRLRAVRPFCPHLGAHLGHGGRVRDEELVCPFHHFAFGPEGECVRTGYGTPPPRARLSAVASREVAGLVFVWWHARGEPPSWEVTAPPAADGFGPVRCLVRTLVAHPQDFMENVIDTGHFTPIHRIGVRMVEEPRFDGPRMTSAYRLARVDGKKNVLFSSAPVMRATVQGLGVFIAESNVPTIGMEMRAWFCVVPLDPVRIELRLAVAVRFAGVRHRGTARALAALAPGPLAWFSTFETNRDLPIWAHNTYLEHPRLAQGDGPITKYRRWARQFYSDWPGETRPARRPA